MINLRELSVAEIQRAKYEKDHHENGIVRKRFNAIFLTYLGYEREQISEIACLHRNSIRKYIKQVNKNGLDSLCDLNYQGSQNALTPHLKEIEAAFRANPPRNSTEAAKLIQERTTIQRSPNRVRVFMHKIGMKCCKMGHIPAKADPEKQEKFLQEKLEPLIEQAQQGKCHLFFMDAAHFILEPFVCMCWCFARLFLKAASGRNRINVLGAIHALSHHFETVINTDYINAQTIEQLLEQIAAKFTDLPVYIVLDNARYQHCAFVKAVAERLHIQLVFLPPYSPNLNLIERLWKFIRKKALYGTFYDSAKLFHQAIQQTVNAIQTKQFQKELDSLLRLNFQTFAQNQPC
jgi:transposase